MLRCVLLAVLLGAAPLHAQSPANAEEIAFWETVRDSKNPAELQAYIDQYPTGRFVVLARTRLAALQKSAPAAPARQAPPKPEAAVASYAPSSVTSATRLPQVGDTWTYRLSYPRMRGQWGQATKPASTQAIRIGEVSEGRIVDQLSIDGGSPSEGAHSSGTYLAPQGVSVFSPYLVAFRDLAKPGSLGTIASFDGDCGARFTCEASARALGNETVTVPAGTFNALKVQVSQTWRTSGSASGAGAGGGGMSGGRNLTVWYVPELKRAIKVESRATVGDTPPVEPTFDLELTSYRVK